MRRGHLKQHTPEAPRVDGPEDIIIALETLGRLVHLRATDRTTGRHIIKRMRPAPSRCMDRTLHGQPEVPQLAARLRRLDKNVLELDVPMTYTCVRRFRVLPRSSGARAASTRLVSVGDGAGSSQLRLRAVSDTDERALAMRVGQSCYALSCYLDDDIQREGHARRRHMVQ